MDGGRGECRTVQTMEGVGGRSSGPGNEQAGIGECEEEEALPLDIKGWIWTLTIKTWQWNPSKAKPLLKERHLRKMNPKQKINVVTNVMEEAAEGDECCWGQ